MLEFPSSIPECDLNPCFDFSSLRVALSNFKSLRMSTEEEGGRGGGDESMPSASGLSL